MTSLQPVLGSTSAGSEVADFSLNSLQSRVKWELQSNPFFSVRTAWYWYRPTGYQVPELWLETCRGRNCTSIAPRTCQTQIPQPCRKFELLQAPACPKDAQPVQHRFSDKAEGRICRSQAPEADQPVRPGPAIYRQLIAPIASQALLILGHGWEPT